ncbi:hypothetical protein MsAg5_12230 [Methanosarcinaceae archaeon Ag5]|uniref:Uncharacterized protein n=1 Tax=Methanolapillus africanus TaxID=3028297 RepID=A0AAE4SE76_9EURY|nr:hypothetical protein [Methanosarcinaceae archaeon Ag5]
MTPEQIIFILSSMLPGIYLAAQKNFIYTMDKRYNRFLIRAIFTIPGLSILILVVSILIIAIISDDILDVSKLSYFDSIIPIILSIILIYIFRKYIIADDEPEILSREEKNYELFIYIPNAQIRYSNTRYEIINKKRTATELMIKRQTTDLSIEWNPALLEDGLIMTIHGEIVVNENTLNVLEQNGINGYATRPVKIFKSSGFQIQYLTDKKYYQIVCKHIMPQLSSPTVIKIKKLPLKIWVENNKYYYKSDVMGEIFDLNQTFEHFGDDFYISQRFWVISKKMKELLVKQFNQTEDDFIPIILIDDEKNEKQV